MVMKTNKEAGLLRAGGSIYAINAGVEGVQPAVRSLRVVCDMHQSLFVTNADGMQWTRPLPALVGQSGPLLVVR
jgi:hypothetical protein